MESTLPSLWYFLLTAMLLLFLILDGADLGIGLMSLFVAKERSSRLIDKVGPQWYANETWLVISGATLFGAFPLAYSLILSSLYLPVMLLIFGLILRAAVTELRGHLGHDQFWNLAFGTGCLLAALGQGLLLGGLLANPQALSSSGNSAWAWFNPLSLLTAVGLAGAFVTLGASQLVRRGGKDLPGELKAFLRYGALLTAIVFLILMAWIPLVSLAHSEIWFSGYRQVLVPLFALIAVCSLAAAWLASRPKCAGGSAYVWILVAFLGMGGALMAGTYPFIIPFSLPISEAASPANTLVFMLFGVGLLLPVIIIYNLYVARVFSAKKPI